MPAMRFAPLLSAKVGRRGPLTVSQEKMESSMAKIAAMGMIMQCLLAFLLTGGADACCVNCRCDSCCRSICCSCPSCTCDQHQEDMIFDGQSGNDANEKNPQFSPASMLSSKTATGSDGIGDIFSCRQDSDHPGFKDPPMKPPPCPPVLTLSQIMRSTE